MPTATIDLGYWVSRFHADTSARVLIAPDINPLDVLVVLDTYGLPRAQLSGITDLHLTAPTAEPPPDFVMLPLITVYHANDHVILYDLSGTSLTGTVRFDAGYADDIFDAQAATSKTIVFGGDGNDTLIGGSNDDIFQGDAGDDALTGSGATDTGAWTGARNEYVVRTYADNGVLKTTVVHQGGAHTDGIDTLIGVETLQFSDHAFVLAGAQLNHTSNVDGDRFDDVLFQNATDGQVYFAKMVDGTFQSWGIDTATLGTDWRAIGSGDVNPGPTGGAETFVQQQSTGTIWYASLDTGSITWGVVDAAPGLNWKLRAIADMNGDAGADAVLQNTTTGAIKYAAMFNGAFAGYDIVNQNLTPDWSLVGAGDINRDGLADAVIQQQSTGTIYYAVMTSGVFQSWGVVSQSLTPDWHVRAVADVTGDGFADVIIQQAGTGTTYFADMQNGVFNHWGVVTANVTADWVAHGTADVDNDGFNDVLFQTLAGGGGVNPGTTYYANMGPSGFEGWGTVAGTISSDWHVV